MPALHWLRGRVMPWRFAESSWRERDAQTPRRYWASADQPHRDALLAVLAQFDDAMSFLELGCSAGPNLARLAIARPEARLSGVDIHDEAIRYARERFAEADLSVKLVSASYRDHLRTLAENSEDVVFSCYALAYTPPQHVGAMLGEALRVARCGLVIAEPHATQGRPPGLVKPAPEWRHDYMAELRHLGVSPSSVDLSHVPPSDLNCATVVTL